MLILTLLHDYTLPQADLFPKLEDDVLLQDPTYRGDFLTGLAFLAMGVLAVVETGAYWQSGYRSTVFMDKDLNGQVRINFNITMHDLSCDYATIDLVRVKQK
jgi:hypothetical protein